MPTRYVPPRFVPTPGVANGMEYKDGPVGIGPSVVPVAGVPLTTIFGAGTASGMPSGVVTINATAAGNAANTNLQTLWTYTLPANTLNANGRAVRVRVWGTFAANGNTKLAHVYFGATQAVTYGGAPNNESFFMDAIVVRTGAATQVTFGWGLRNGLVDNLATTAAETLTGDVAITFKAQSSVTGAANDIVFKGAVVEVL